MNKYNQIIKEYTAVKKEWDELLDLDLSTLTTDEEFEQLDKDQENLYSKLHEIEEKIIKMVKPEVIKHGMKKEDFEMILKSDRQKTINLCLRYIASLV